MPTDLRSMLKEAAPDDWEPLELGALVQEAHVRKRRRRIMEGLGALAAVLIVAFAASTVVRAIAVQEINTADDPQNTEDSGDAPSEDESAPPPGSLPRSGGGSAPGVLGGSSEDSRSGGSPSEVETSRRSETAGPPVYYTDQADDANNTSTPNAASQREYDILRVDWAPVPYVNEQSPGGYSTSMTVAGSAQDEGAYVSWGGFGEDCQLYHRLIPGTTAYASAYCDSSGLLPFGRVEGGPVTSTPTPSGGTRLTATFDSRTIPPELEAAGRTLRNLSAYTCAEKAVCKQLDWVYSALSYRI